MLLQLKVAEEIEYRDLLQNTTNDLRCDLN